MTMRELRSRMAELETHADSLRALHDKYLITAREAEQRNAELVAAMREIVAGPYPAICEIAKRALARAESATPKGKCPICGEPTPAHKTWCNSMASATPTCEMCGGYGQIPTFDRDGNETGTEPCQRCYWSATPAKHPDAVPPMKEPTEFYDAKTDRYMQLINEGEWIGWLFWKHRDGQWVSLRKATDEDRAAIDAAMKGVAT